MPNKSYRGQSSVAEAFKQEEVSEMDSTLYIKEEQTSSDESRIKQKSNIRRHRASVACTSCRDRRIRCVVPIGKKACVQCERSCAPCIIKDDDERRKPISRAYVYSLVERVALLEQMLEDQGLKVPPASYPPETRHHSRRSKGTSSADNASSFSSTPQESSVSDDHATSSPYCSYQDERLVKGAKKRSSVSISADLEGNRSNKRTRNDSLITLADVKVEPEVDNPLDSITPYDGTFGFGHAATVVASHQPPFWPMAYDHTGGLTALDPTPQDTNIEYSAFSAWCDNSFGYHEYSTHIVPTQYDERLPGPHHHDGNGLSRSFSTNLDFMPLGTGGSGT